MKPLDARILDLYESLTPLEQRLANVLLEHQRELASYSATELARRAAVSKATAARLFKRLGYRSYEEARRQSRALHRWGSPLSLLDSASQEGDEQPSVVAHLRDEISNLTRSFEAVSPQLLEQAAAALAGARRIWLIGFRASRPLAELAAFWLNYLKEDVRIVPGGAMSFAEHVIDLRPADLVFAIGLRRRPRVFRAFLQTARDLGATIVLLTDLSAPATAQLADIVIRCHSRSPGVFDSYTVAASMVNYLLGRLALMAGVQIRPRLQRIEEIADRLDVFTVPGRKRGRARARAKTPNGTAARR